MKIVKQEHTCEYSGVTFPTAIGEGRKHGLDFGAALAWMKKGRSVTKGNWLNHAIIIWIEHDARGGMKPYFKVKTRSGMDAVWNPTHQDLMAEDYEISE